MSILKRHRQFSFRKTNYAKIHAFDDENSSRGDACSLITKIALQDNFIEPAPSKVCISGYKERRRVHFCFVNHRDFDNENFFGSC
jgi:hypothetical protein